MAICCSMCPNNDKSLAKAQSFPAPGFERRGGTDDKGRAACANPKIDYFARQRPRYDPNSQRTTSGVRRWICHGAPDKVTRVSSTLCASASPRHIFQVMARIGSSLEMFTETRAVNESSRAEYSNRRRCIQQKQKDSREICPSIDPFLKVAAKVQPDAPLRVPVLALSQREHGVVRPGVHDAQQPRQHSHDEDGEPGGGPEGGEDKGEIRVSREVQGQEACHPKHNLEEVVHHYPPAHAVNRVLLEHGEQCWEAPAFRSATTQSAPELLANFFPNRLDWQSASSAVPVPYSKRDLPVAGDEHI